MGRGQGTLTRRVGKRGTYLLIIAHMQMSKHATEDCFGRVYNEMMYGDH